MTMELPSDWKKFNADECAKIPPAIRAQAVIFLRGYFTADVCEQIIAAEKADPQEWWVGHHAFWGMGVRNALRSAGYGEKALGVDNLDDVYIGLIEEALINQPEPEKWTPGRKFI